MDVFLGRVAVHHQVSLEATETVKSRVQDKQIYLDFGILVKSYMSDKPTVDKLSSRRDLGPEAYAEFALSWVEQGATIVGGCCEVGPAHIRLLAERLQQAGHQIV